MREPTNELFTAEFNLRGELIDNSPTAEGQARARAESQAQQEKEQQRLFEADHEPMHFDCTGNFDGFTCGSDADPGL